MKLHSTLRARTRNVVSIFFLTLLQTQPLLILDGKEDISLAAANVAPQQLLVV